MRVIKNTLYITTQGSYLSLDGENVVISKEHSELGTSSTAFAPGYHNFWICKCKFRFTGKMCTIWNRNDIYDHAWEIFGEISRRNEGECIAQKRAI